ncbi:hypothetical protein KHQ06_19715 [Nocardia tengchongensis]|uniref:Uncharacterized protein n=1 Tax=Nocardia tengchongensis TaxID=2055889 RepID=A0ABX8CFL6_9NOCA|nr:hypothetical protein KHQ06_19715 [Nocardia tengchongensis]
MSAITGDIVLVAHSARSSDCRAPGAAAEPRDPVAAGHRTADRTGLAHKAFHHGSTPRNRGNNR